VPRDEQFGAIKELLDTGVIRNAGLSEVSVRDIKAACKVFKVATVQNRYKPGSLLDSIAKRHGLDAAGRHARRRL
jgi:aryl-alcohol dehydrogenase-like predicted oxidoreductase